MSWEKLKLKKAKKDNVANFGRLEKYITFCNLSANLNQS